MKKVTVEYLNNVELIFDFSESCCEIYDEQTGLYKDFNYKLFEEKMMADERVISCTLSDNKEWYEVIVKFDFDSNDDYKAIVGEDMDEQARNDRRYLEDFIYDCFMAEFYPTFSDCQVEMKDFEQYEKDIKF